MVLVLAVLPTLMLRADHTMYRVEVGLQSGAGYYVGDATAHIFHDIAEVAGAQVRYKFDERWSLQAKGQWQRIRYFYEDTKYHNPTWNVDLAAEFNFFRFGRDPYDERIKPLTPYMFIGMGMTVYYKQALEESAKINLLAPFNDHPYDVNMYIPLGVGLKWMFAERWQLQLAWQHQVYIVNGDGLEGQQELNNRYELNGSNIMNNDLTSSLTVGVVFELWKKGDKCVNCE